MLLYCRSNEVDFSQALIDLTKYAQSLEHIIRFKNREIQRLEYLNKYLVIAQQKRDEMLTHTLEENRKLKELSIRNEKKYTGPDKRQKRQSMGDIPTAITGPKAWYNPHFNKSSATATNPVYTQKKGSNEPNKTSTQKSTVKYVDEKKSQSILKISKSTFGSVI